MATVKTLIGNIKGPQGEQGIQGIQGIQGVPGERGLQGERGPQGNQGVQGPQGSTGPAGKTPVRGTDYWTPSDIAEIKSHCDSIIASYNPVAVLSGVATPTSDVGNDGDIYLVTE
ncbi:MAG: collagen-like protein [Oscillospiraceae bacterium]|nr:collagen-like protein [Oscillospiraceae bacterium]